MNPQPWRAPDAQPGSFAAGMLGLEERKLLYHLARDMFSGSGEIVDLGAFCGASALCLAAGLRDNPRAEGRKVHSFDRFIADEPYMVDFLAAKFGETLPLGASFEPIFRRATAEMSDRIAVHAGDLLAEAWPDDTPIEILFVDAAKTLALSGHILRAFFPRLIPGKSVVVQQDFYHPGTFYLVVVMDFLRDHFEVIEEQRDWSAAFRLISEIPQWKIDAAAEYRFGYREQRAAITRTMARLGRPARDYLRVARSAAIGTYRGARAFKLSFLFSTLRIGLAAKDPIMAECVAWGRRFDATRIRTRLYGEPHPALG